MTIQEVMDAIHQHAYTGQSPGLDRMKQLLSRLNNPQQQLNVVHIGGTNGKGSTAAITSSILSCAGFRTGLYTSPHLWSFRERFQINGQPIPHRDLEEVTETVLEVARQEGLQPTEFELMTAMALVYFCRQQCDLVVLEVGMGGRLDSTNVIPKAQVSVLTHIGLDHTRELGDTLEKIAWEKAGIIPRGGTVVLYPQEERVMEVVQQVAKGQGASLTIPCSSDLSILEQGWEGTTFLYGERGPYHLPLLGKHQVWNSSVVLEVVEALRRKGWTIPEQGVEQGFQSASWPGRMELVQREPYILLDGGHNPQGIEALRTALESLHLEQSVLFCFGTLEDKAYIPMIQTLLPLAMGFVTVQPKSPRGLEATRLAQEIQNLGGCSVACATLPEALDLLQQWGRHQGARAMVVCGSLYMIGEARHYFGLC